jgi:diadenosine tetraphosphate (Ap4A) HIT family hydrolase
MARGRPSFTSLNRDCRFCMLPEPWRVIAETGNYRVLMGLGPLTPGYALIISKTHLSCTGAIPHEQLGEFMGLVDALSEAQIDLYGASLFFEHGRSGSCVREGGGEDLCFHAHLHLLPTHVNLARLVGVTLELNRVPSWLDVLRAYEEREQPYLLAQDGNEIVLATPFSGLPPRYLRTLLARELGTESLSDWVAFPSYQIIRDELPRLRETLSRRLAHGR